MPGTALEHELVEAASTGAWLDFTNRWEQEVPADFLSLVLRSTGSSARLRAVRLRGARIAGALDLEGATLPCPLELEACAAAEPVNLREAGAPTIRFVDSEFVSVNADQLETRGDLELSRISVTQGLSLSGAHVGGQLDLSGASLRNVTGPALAADGLKVDQDVFFRPDGDRMFMAIGEVSLIGAHICGQLDMSGASLNHETRWALTADGLRVDQAMFCTVHAQRRFTVLGDVRLVGARIDGRLVLNGAYLRSPRGAALATCGLHVGQDMLCTSAGGHSFIAIGETRLNGAHIGGRLVFSGAFLRNPHGAALTAEVLEVDHDMVCASRERRFTAIGGVRLRGAHVGGRLVFDGASLRSEDGIALDADGVRVDQDMSCSVKGDDRFTATGEVRVRGAHIAGELRFNGAMLLHQGHRPAMTADGIRVTLDAWFHRVGEYPFEATGEVRLARARIGSQLTFNHARLCGHRDAQGNLRPAVQLHEAEIPSLWLRLDEVPHGKIDIRRARIGSISDRVIGEDRTWAVTRLQGCQYDRLDAADAVGAKERLRWLQSDNDTYSSQPYEQLAQWYKRAGHDGDARMVGIEKHKRHRRELGRGRRSWLPRLWSWFLGATVAHGYRPSQALLWLLLLLIGGWLVFDHGEFDPAKTNPAAFDAVLYTLDVLLPVVSLGQESSWNPRGAAQVVSAGLAICGWLLTAALLAGIATRRQ